MKIALTLNDGDDDGDGDDIAHSHHLQARQELCLSDRGKSSEGGLEGGDGDGGEAQQGG